MAVAIRTCVALLPALAVSGCATTPGPVTSDPGTTFGKIFVDTPEVYSRERLVNDRFQQDDWLRKKLGESPTQGLQGGVGTSSQTNTQLSLAAGVKPDAPKKEQLEKSESAQEITDTPIEQLRDTMAYREEVRNEILENQLDDRHDIAGNTLYRLKFDTTVVPLHDTSAYAMVEVTIKGSSFWDFSGEYANVLMPEEKQYSGIPLPEYDLARYVTGLDEATLSSFERVYGYWVRDVNPPIYSNEEIEFGEMQKYFDFDDFLNQILEKVNCRPYSSEAQVNAVLTELKSRNVPTEYLDAGTFYEVFEYTDDTGQPVVETTTFHHVCVKTGLANFISDLKDHHTAIYTYAVTPKERVQRVYGNTLAAGSMGISVGAEQNGLGAALAHSNAREARANAIMRQPQIVGYSPNAHLPSEATMGWLIGPRYKISDDPDSSVSFRHVPTQHTLTGIVSVPSWWSELTLITRAFWLDENGVEYSQEGVALTPDSDAKTGHEVKITLPADVTSIDTVFDPKRRQPRLEESAGQGAQNELSACRKGTVVIRGSQLWRSTVVTLGGQQADSISVLPNMKGVIATFNRVEPSISGTEPLNLWTSEGELFVRNMAISGDCPAEIAPSS